ncbi:hypothetical protein [Accumulibacter sp.]|uniref:hypothetical protein n=1 Tax=Accumulibacter sp. TaxID=2053492 RepID=UPI0026154619|nr:hypothetical protein [Accumulibacter sp.]
MTTKEEHSDILIHAIVGKYHPGTPREKAEIASQMVERKHVLQREASEVADRSRRMQERSTASPEKQAAPKAIGATSKRVKRQKGSDPSAPRIVGLKDSTQ